MNLGIRVPVPVPPALRPPTRWSAIWPVLLGLALWLMHSSVLGDWIVDDAGISFSYARNLALGHGLVAQAGAEPVEGFTNLLLVLFHALLMRLGVFDPLITPKLLGFVCVGGAFLLVMRVSRGRVPLPGWLAAAALAVTAGSTGFAVWCASGLENALYAMLVALLAASCVPGAGRSSSQHAGRAGLICFAVFCTRPDGALYFWILPFLLGLDPDGARRGALRRYVTGFVGPWLALTLFRIAYFHDVMPNTFYAKRGEGANLFAWLLDHLGPWPAGAIVMVLGSGVIVAVAWGFERLGRRLAAAPAGEWLARHVLLLFLATAVLVHQALRGDWMAEYRFATPAFLFGPIALLSLAWDPLRHSRNGRMAAPALALLAVAGCALIAWPRTAAFARTPTISFASVRANSDRIAAVIEPLGPDATVLTPDIGGALWQNRFRVLDLAGLVDRRLARYRDGIALRDHLLLERRPEVVWMHTFWLAASGLETDPRFVRDYVPIWSTPGSPGGKRESGLWVRRDLAARVAQVESKGVSRGLMSGP